MEFRTERHGSEFDVTHHSALPLSVEDDGGQEVTLVPGARVSVRLAVWRGDSDIVLPAVLTKPFQYYDDLARHTYEYRFTVIAFDKDGRFASEAFSLKPGA